MGHGSVGNGVVCTVVAGVYGGGKVCGKIDVRWGNDLWEMKCAAVERLSEADVPRRDPAPARVRLDCPPSCHIKERYLQAVIDCRRRVLENVQMQMPELTRSSASVCPTRPPGL